MEPRICVWGEAPISAHPEFLHVFDRAAREAQRRELLFRDEAALEIARLEQDRKFAFRRLNLIRAVASAITDLDDADRMIAAGLSALARELGWEEDQARERLRERFAPVVLETGKAARGEASDVTAALSAFEQWYQDAVGTPFLALLEIELPERPVVEF